MSDLSPADLLKVMVELAAAREAKKKAPPTVTLHQVDDGVVTIEERRLDRGTKLFKKEET